MKIFFKYLNQSLLFTFLMLFTCYCYAVDVKDKFNTASNVYIYAFPAVLSEISKQVMTNVSSAQMNGRAPLNQFSHADQLATPENKDVVRPNHDTLYSIAWLDLSNEPMILSVPDTKDRYYVMPFIDMWTEVFDSVGKRTTGNAPGNFVIIGPNWQGELPKDMSVITSLTNTAWITGRTLVNSQEDLQNARAIQQGYKLTPLSQWGSDYQPPENLPVDAAIDMVTTPLNQVKKMDAVTYFTLFAKILKTNPPHAEDTAILDQLKIIGIVPGKDFDSSVLTRAEIKELDRAVIHALRLIELHVRKLGDVKNGWHTAHLAGRYGIAYLDRAAVAYIGIGANIPEDSIYPSTFDDQRSKSLNGAYRYLLHFDAKNIPPVNGFWSITLYGPDNYLVANSQNRYALGDRSPMQFNPDGSLDIYIQNDTPGKNKESNWLPAPQGDFSLTLRLYWPKPEALSGEWQATGVRWNPR